jgi:AraC-like DNA-binding protein
MPTDRNSDFSFEHPGFSAFSGQPSPRQHHRHDELELAIFEHGSLVALYGGRQMTVPPGRLVVLWGAMPHRTLRLLGDTVGQGIRVPLPWVLRWKLPEALVRRLLNFDVILAPVQESPGSDLSLVKQWVRFMESGLPAGREIVLLEVQARLLRLALEWGAKTRGRSREPAVPPVGDGVGLFERILRIVSDRYQQRLSIPEIARELRVSRVHVMRQFQKITGMSVLDYITQCRVSCAQRLLATTDMKLLDIAAEAGFNSAARFYPCFKRLAGQSPARYRRSMRAAASAEPVATLFATAGRPCPTDRPAEGGRPWRRR